MSEKSDLIVSIVDEYKEAAKMTGEITYETTCYTVLSQPGCFAPEQAIRQELLVQKQIVERSFTIMLTHILNDFNVEQLTKYKSFLDDPDMREIFFSVVTKGASDALLISCEAMKQAIKELGLEEDSLASQMLVEADKLASGVMVRDYKIVDVGLTEATEKFRN